MIATLNSCCPPSRNRVPYSTFKYPLSNKQPCMWTRSQYHVKSSRKRSFFCKLCACKQKHSSVVGRLTETDQIQIRDDTTSRACLRTVCYIGITTADSTFKYPMASDTCESCVNNIVATRHTSNDDTMLSESGVLQSRTSSSRQKYWQLTATFPDIVESWTSKVALA